MTQQGDNRIVLDSSGIQWTGTTWNPWIGCMKKSPGCKNCYMYRQMTRYKKDPKVVKRTSNGTFYKPLKLNKEVDKGIRTGNDRLVFTCSWSDWFNEEADDWRLDAWGVIRDSPNHTFQILTKLPERIQGNLPHSGAK